MGDSSAWQPPSFKGWIHVTLEALAELAPWGGRFASQVVHGPKGTLASERSSLVSRPPPPPLLFLAASLFLAQIKLSVPFW